MIEILFENEYCITYYCSEMSYNEVNNFIQNTARAQNKPALIYWETKANGEQRIRVV